MRTWTQQAEVQLFYLKMPFGVRDSSGARRCAADLSQAFSLY